MLDLDWLSKCSSICLVEMMLVDFRDLFKEEEFVAAGTLKRDEQVLRGKDGRRYKGRNDVIKFDIDLTQAIQVKLIMPQIRGIHGPQI